ncbi:MAG: outer membrane lipid asymmetry maintenance protein MlaD, partial [Desulfuromonas sp.]
MKKFSLETAVGLFLVVGFLCFAWISIKLGNLEVFGGDKYTLTARFSSIAGLKVGSNVEIAGVKIGRVTSITLDIVDFDAEVALEIQSDVQLPEDSIASIRTAGIIGDRYVNLSPGGLDDLIPPGGEITETESAINIEELVSKYI